ncbi:hypothetical protein HanLR1_Chr04g0146071 [Helianthus annuus]|nr:hypothetical protein HanLR1_Chr04g0146071 [Helianthus annuus]
MVTSMLFATPSRIINLEQTHAGIHITIPSGTSKRGSQGMYLSRADQFDDNDMAYKKVKIFFNWYIKVYSHLTIFYFSVLPFL